MTPAASWCRERRCRHFQFQISHPEQRPRFLRKERLITLLLSLRSLFTSSLHLLYQLPSPDLLSPFHHPSSTSPSAPFSSSFLNSPTLRILYHRRPRQSPKQAAMPNPSSLLRLLLLMLLSAVAASNDGSHQAAPRRDELVPVAPTAELGAMALGLMNETARRRLGGSFQLCAPCTCCGGSRGACVLSPCCYSINCNIPNRPFGYCSFTPKSCDCLGCNL